VKQTYYSADHNAKITSVPPNVKATEVYRRKVNGVYVGKS
jgi:hypothetical protein